MTVHFRLGHQIVDRDIFPQNKRLSKGKKGLKKKVVDPFSRKGLCHVYTLARVLHADVELDWYNIKAPSIFEVKEAGKTLANRSQGLSACKMNVSTSLHIWIRFTSRKCKRLFEGAYRGGFACGSQQG